MRKETSVNKLSDTKLQYIQKYLKGTTVLDTGAGYCYYSEWLVKTLPHLTVVSVDQLELASHNGIEYHSLDLEKQMPLEDNRFSTVLAFDIIEHLSNEELFIKELHRICQPDGTLIGSVPHDDDQFLPAYNLTFYHRSDVTHKRYYLPHTLQEALEKAGFSIITIDGKGGISPQVIAEFFPSQMRYVIKKGVGLLRRLGIINATRLQSDLFFVAKKN